MVWYLTQPNTAEFILPNEILSKEYPCGQNPTENYTHYKHLAPSPPEIVSETNFLEPSNLVKISSLKGN